MNSGTLNPAADVDSPRLSIIVPVLNEAASIQAFLLSVRKSCEQRVQVIVVDGGSTDATAALARPHCDCLIESRKGRATQMNAGARQANTNVLWFVHADSRLPRHADALIIDALQRSGRRWGYFDVRLSGGRLLLRVVERLMNWRSAVTGIATGDQGLYVSRKLFERIGGFPDIALMEDIAISRRLKKAGRPAVASQPLVTSSRRWEKNGILRTIVLMWKLRLYYFLGVDPGRLAHMYYGRND